MLLFIILLVMQVLDIYTTWYILTKKSGTELNPILAKAFKYFGILLTLFIVKSLALALVYYFLISQPIILASLCAFYLLILIHNFKEMRK